MQLTPTSSYTLPNGDTYQHYHGALIASVKATLEAQLPSILAEIAADIKLLAAPCPGWGDLTYGGVIRWYTQIQEDETYAIPIGTYMAFSDGVLGVDETVFGQLGAYHPDASYRFHCEAHGDYRNAVAFNPPW